MALPALRNTTSEVRNETRCGAGGYVVSEERLNHDAFTLPEGRVVLQWPARLSPESYADLKDWLDLMARRIARVVHEQPPATAVEGGQS